MGKFTDPDLGTVSISAIALKRELPGWLKPNNSNNRVFHAVNGQVQYKQTRGYLSQCGFPALKDRVVIIVDASVLTFSAHNEVWKGDREHISSTIDGERYKELVTKTIKESKTLDELQRKVAQEELERASKAESNELFQKLVDKDRTLAGLLSSREPTIRLPSSGGGKSGHDAGDEEYEGAYSPTFIRFEEKFDAGVTDPKTGETSCFSPWYRTAWSKLIESDSPTSFRCRLEMVSMTASISRAASSSTNVPARSSEREI